MTPPSAKSLAKAGICIWDDTNNAWKAWRGEIKSPDGTDIGVQNPLPVDGDSVYAKDVNTATSSIGGFSGAVTDLVDSLTSTIVDSSATNPKTFTIALERPIHCFEVGINTPSGDFSNVSIIAKDASGATLETIDDSANNTKYTHNEYNFTSIDHFSTLTFTFSTADTVTLGFLDLDKSIHTLAHLHALKPDGTVTAIDATAGGNLKVSVEELESGISSNSNSQLNVTRFDSSGVEEGLKVNDPILSLVHGSNPLISTTSLFNKFGSSPDVTSAATEELWDGARAYIFPTSASVTHIRSAVDSAITRAVTLEVQGLDVNWDLVVQTKATDATDSTVEIELDTALRRVFRVKVLDDTALDQDIWVGPDPASAANASAIVQAGNNQTLMAIWTVPNGCTAYLTNYYCDYVRSAAKDPNGISYDLWARDNANGYAPQLKHQKGIPKQAPGFQHNFKPYYRFAEKTDVYLTGSPEGADAHAHGGFDIILIAN